MEVGRLAFRHEGEWWNAYWSPDQHSMDKAVQLGSIRMAVVRGSLREEFIKLMRLAFEEASKDALGATPEWGGLHRAPESERSGHG
jgi:hypothetical protein